MPFFEEALKSDTNNAQFWLSYIDTLISLDKVAHAIAAFYQAKNNGAQGYRFDQLEKRLGLSNTNVIADQNLEEFPSNILDKYQLDQALRHAIQKAKNGLVKEAQEIYQDILARFPRNKRALIGMKALLSSPKFQVSLNQNPTPNQLQDLIYLYAEGKFDEALNKASQLLIEFSKSFVLYNFIGATKQGLGKIEEAINSYKKALSLNSNYAEAYNNMGLALKDQGKLDDAIKAYNNALSIKPDYADAYNNMGIVLRDQGKLDDAIKAYNKALSIKPDYADAYNNMGNALKDQGNLDDAIKAYNKALSIKPDYADIYNNIGIALRDRGNLDDAIKAYNNAL